MNKRIKMFIAILLVGVLAFFISGANTSSASPGATASFTFDAQMRSLTISINSPIGISSAQIKLDIPAALSIGSVSATGFMTGATHLAHETEHRWFTLSANSEKSGTLIIPITLAKNEEHTELLGIALKDTQGNQVPVDMAFPIGLTIPGTGAIPAPVLIAESRTVLPGGTVQVPILLNKAENVGNMDFTLTYDPTVVQAYKVTKGSLLAGGTLAGNLEESGIIRFGFATAAGISGSGSIATVEFRVVGAEGDSSPLSFSNVLANDATTGAELTIDLVHGILTIGKQISGDGNGDGKITELDALLALKMSVGLLPIDLKMDMNDDAQVTSADARIILVWAVKGG